MTRSRSLSQIAEFYSVSTRTVEHWVARGELRAVNVSRNPDSKKPRLRVLEEDLQRFLSGRTVNAKNERPPRQRTRLKKPPHQYV